MFQDLFWNNQIPVLQTISEVMLCCKPKSRVVLLGNIQSFVTLGDPTYTPLKKSLMWNGYTPWNWRE